MKTFTTLLSGLAALTGLAAAGERTVPIYIQPVAVSPPAPVLLGEVVYDDALLLPSSDPGAAAAKVTSFEYPSDLLSPDSSSDDDENDDEQRAAVASPPPRYVRVGAWDPVAKSWASSTSLASTANFDKGFAPHFVVTVDTTADVVGVVLKGVRIDAGQTRDFGPQVVLRTAAPGSQVELNKPIVLSPEGRKVEEEPEKTLLQKYWWIIGIVLMLSLTGGGGDGK